MVRVSRSVRDLAYKVLQSKEKLTKEKGKEPTVDEIAKDLEVDREEVVMSLDAIQDPVSLQEPVYNDGGDSIYILDQIKDKKNTDEMWTENLTISEAMKKLSAIVKIASGLDITQHGYVTDIFCDVLGDSVIMKTTSENDISFEIKYGFC